MRLYYSKPPIQRSGEAGHAPIQASLPVDTQLAEAWGILRREREKRGIRGVLRNAILFYADAIKREQAIEWEEMQRIEEHRAEMSRKAKERYAAMRAKQAD